ncbi:MAG: OmpH family outer membrane protein [Acidobacteria bacterium]|jgi:Skp family chaperone for outer membrane proteins|nr:OmpH family outer membrane protein [Acidobacteriota bacterium]
MFVSRLRTISLMATLGLILAAAAASAQTTTPPAAEASRLFPPDSKVAFVDLQRIFNQSAYGKKSVAQITALETSLTAGLAERSKNLQALSEKVKTQQGIVAETTWLTWNADLLRMQREAQFAQQEAQIQVEQLQQSLLGAFEKVVTPMIETVRKERGLWLVFALQPATADTAPLSLVAADPALDLSAEIVRRLDGQ